GRGIRSGGIRSGGILGSRSIWTRRRLIGSRSRRGRLVGVRGTVGIGSSRSGSRSSSWSEDDSSGTAGLVLGDKDIDNTRHDSKTAIESDESRCGAPEEDNGNSPVPFLAAAGEEDANRDGNGDH